MSDSRLYLVRMLLGRRAEGSKAFQNTRFLVRQSGFVNLGTPVELQGGGASGTSDPGDTHVDFDLQAQSLSQEALFPFRCTPPLGAL